MNASNDYWQATNYYSVASEDDAIARQDIAAAMRATAIEKNAIDLEQVLVQAIYENDIKALLKYLLKNTIAIKEHAHDAADRYVKGANMAQSDE